MSKIPVKIKIGNKSYDTWANSTQEEEIMREAGKIIDAQITKRMSQIKGEGKEVEILSMVCLDVMVARLKGDKDLDTIQSEMFRRLGILKKHFGLTDQ